MFDEQKLRRMNGRYLRELAVEELTRRLETLTGRAGLGEAVAISQEKISTLAEFWPLAGFFFDGPVDDPAAREKILGSPEALERLEQARERAGRDRGAVDATRPSRRRCRAWWSARAKPRQVFQPLRVALAGTTVSPGIFETVGCSGATRRWRGSTMSLNRLSTVADTG